MGRTLVTRRIEAPAARVFDTVAHIEEFAKALPRIQEIEFLTTSQRGAGTRFRETRLVRGREMITELEVTEYIPDERVRLVSDQGGTIWDSLFAIEARDSSCELSLLMDARPYRLAARIINPLIGRMVRKAIEADLDAVKAYCERDGD